MNRRRDVDGKRIARGGLLLETLLALVILVMIGTLALGVARDAIKATERSDRRAAAVELAATRMAEIEAGLIEPQSVGDLEESPLEDDDSGTGRPPMAVRRRGGDLAVGLRRPPSDRGGGPGDERGGGR